eukprot:TRINITY_DN6275_c0_g1_i1.p1 TRINITY_DN6275_c0_g1~~TRINITY_DN6275_c0_g1_i1.p1  ORF type:complete len:868 (+),score=296.92 TRINITY_DN6275_c0_g1_i1:229-2832(+)
MDTNKPRIRVHTISIEQVLSPIADKVSELIIFDEQARQQGTPMPDLTPSAEHMALSIKNLCAVGLQSMANGDDQLKSRMPSACEQIEAAGKLFMDATVQLKLDPLSDSGRTMLVQAARGLLTGTTNLLMTFDAFEVRKIVNLGEAIIELLATAKQIKTLDELVVIIRSVKESLIAFARLSDARYKELINANLRSRLLVANETLRKGSPLLVSALHTYIQNNANEQALSSRDYAVDQMLNATHEIIVVVSSTDLDESGYADSAGAFHMAVEDAKAQLMTAAVGVDTKQLDANLQRALAVGANAASTCAHDPYRQELEATMDTLRSDFQQLELHVQGPECEMAATRLEQDLSRFEQVLSTAVAYSLTEAEVIGSGPAAPLPKMLNTTSRSGSQEELAVDIQAVEEYSHLLVQSVSNVAAMSNDARRVKLVAINAAQLQEVTEQLSNAARMALDNKGKPAATNHVALLKDTWEYRADVLKATVAGMASPERVILVAGAGLQDDLLNVTGKLQRGRSYEALSNARVVESRVTHLLTIADTEMENSEDAAFQKPIETAASRLRAALPKYMAAVQTLSTSSDDEVARHQVESQAAEIKRGVEQLRYAVKGEEAPQEVLSADGPDLSLQPNDPKLLINMDGVTEATTTDPHEDEEDEDISPTISREPSSLLSPSRYDPANPPTGPIADAAKTLKQETSQWSSRKNPIIATASNMADAMHAMASLANASSKARTGDEAVGQLSEMIGTAKEIAQKANTFRKQAMEIAQGCSDKRLKADLLYLCDRLPTISTQLKIIASVKAASASQTGNAEADNMLIKNAQNLMETVGRMVRAAEAASMKTFASTASSATAGIRWKRKAKSVRRRSMMSVMSNTN